MSSSRGIILKIGATLCTTLMFASVKLLEGAIPAGQVVFFRSLLGMLPLVVWLVIRKTFIQSIRTRHIKSHLLRSLSGTGALFFNFLALAYLPLLDATAINYTIPLMTALLAAFLLGEIVRPYRWIGVATGFVGVFVMLFPHFQALDAPGSFGTMQQTGNLTGIGFGFLGAFCAAFSTIQIRYLGRSESPIAIVFYFSLITTLAGLLTIYFGWVWPTPKQFTLLLCVGAFGGLTQILITTSLRHAHVSTLATFDYATLLWSTTIGILLFNQFPAAITVFGGFIVVAAGVYVLWKESKGTRSIV